MKKKIPDFDQISCKHAGFHKEKQLWFVVKGTPKIASIQLRFHNKHISLDLHTNETILWSVKYQEVAPFLPDLTEANRLSYIIFIQDILHPQTCSIEQKLETLFNFS